MTKSILSAIFWLLMSTLLAQTSPFTIGETFSISSDHLQEERTINMYLPASYQQDSVDNCNVIYLLDGSAHEDFLHIAGLVQFFELMFQLPPTIVVGIANVDRKRDFTYHTDDKELLEHFPTTGHSDRFIQFLKEELRPYIDQHYKTGGKNTLSGQSLGGLLAAEVLLHHAPLFDQYWIISPSMWWDNESMLKEVETLFAQQKDVPLDIFIAVGKEGKVMKRGAKGLYKGIQKNNKTHTKANYLYLPKENHATILHNAIYQALLLDVR